MKIIVSLENRPGSLANFLGGLVRYDANLLTIRSHPVTAEVGKKVFFIELEENAALKLSERMGCLVSMPFTRTQITQVEEFPPTVGNS